MRMKLKSPKFKFKKIDFKKYLNYKTFFIFLIFFFIVAFIYGIISFITLNDGDKATALLKVKDHFTIPNSYDYFKLFKSDILSNTFNVFIMWILGAFSFGGSKSAGGFGYYSANLNTLFYSAPISIFAPNIPNGLISYIFNLSIMPGQYEGYGYLGLGILVLGGICLLLLFKNIKNIKIKIDYLIIIFKMSFLNNHDYNLFFH